MKRAIVLFIVFCLFSTVHSQVWIDSGATWYYEWYTVAEPGFVKIEYTKDTLINGRNCYKLVPLNYRIYFDINFNPYSYSIRYLTPEYTYVSGDTVFYYKNGRFNILYNFGAKPGDSWDLGLDTADAYCSKTIAKVDSIGTIEINSQTYRWISLSTPRTSKFYFTGKVIERFGAFEGYLFPTPKFCDTNIQDGPPVYYFTCYEDNTFPLYNVYWKECDHWLIEIGIDELKPYKYKITTFPNPFTEIVNFQITSSPKISEVIFFLYDIHGKEIIRKDIILRKGNSFNFNRESLVDGVYFFRIHSTGALLGKGKLIFH